MCGNKNVNSPSMAVYEKETIDKTPILFMMCGLPGSGKSTCIDRIEYNGEKPIVHSSDKLREELYGDANVQEKNGELFVELHRRIKEDLKNGNSVVYDATNLSKKRRIAFLNELNKINCKHYCIVILTPYKKCLKQNRMRERVVPDDVILRMYKNFQPPAYSEGWDKIILSFNLDEDDTDDRWNISTLFEGDCGIDNFQQENSHHALTLGLHCRKAHEYICENKPDDERLAIAALLHDEGKIITKSRTNAKGEDDGNCHYYQHHCCGAYNSFFYTMKCGFSEEDMIYISNLIYFHMHPYLEWKQSESVKRRHKIQFGEQFYEDVMLLHEADVNAH